MRRDADWNHYDYRYDPGDGHGPRTAHVRFDVGCALMPIPDSHGTTLRLDVSEEQGPALDEVLWALSDAAWWVGEERFAGRYVAVLQVEDADAVEAEARQLAADLPLTARRSAGWEYFEDRVCPSEHAWRRITDREQLERLGGTELDAPRPVAHAFYGSASGLAKVRARLLGEGFVDASGDATDRLVLHKEHTPATVSEVSVPLLRLARQHGCAYDGWSLVLLALICLLLVGPPAVAAPEASVIASPNPLVIGHRGAPGYLPDHTLEGYRLAVAQGADFIEPDLVPTKDGVLVARHDSELSLTTDVAERFPKRKRTADIDGETLEGWFSTDFTLAELRTLRAKQPYPDRPHDHDGRYLVPTFDEILALRAELEAEAGRPIGIYPELKHPTYHRALGFDLVDGLATALKRAGLADADDPVVVQCFEPSALDAVAKAVAVPRVLLVGAPDTSPADGGPTYGELLSDLQGLRTRVHGLGVPKAAVHDGERPTGLVQAAHAAGLVVHVYTFRNEVRTLSPVAKGQPDVELDAFLALGVDGVFADFPDAAVAARTRHLAAR
jgi:glycerophosphoryl diester phosphodiesterase